MMKNENFGIPTTHASISCDRLSKKAWQYVLSGTNETLARVDMFNNSEKRKDII